MEDKAIALAGAVAAATVLGRGLRPAAKTVINGYLWVADATADARTSVSDLYAEARAEHNVDRQAGADTVASPPPDARETTERRPVPEARGAEGTGA